MPNPQFTKPWHGVPRESIHWNPSVLEDVCIGCGTCVTGCSRLVYRFDFERKKPVVVDPLNCMVGCTTCANTCPAHALVFPPIALVLALEGLTDVRHSVEDDLQARHDILASTVKVPHPDRIISLIVKSIDKSVGDVLRVTLAPVTPGECFCEFAPGQYIELWQPESSHLSRSYSIANAPHGDGSVTLHIRKVEGGRFTQWAFDAMKVGDTCQARGPLVEFTMRSPADMPLLFVAGGTGLAPVLALLEQQANFAPQRDMVLIWGMRQVADFYALDALKALVARAPGLRIILAADKLQSPAEVSPAIQFLEGNVLGAMASDAALPGQRDVYAAGPPVMLRELAHALDALGVDKTHVHMDSFGV
ncbi:MAG: oxidoreductase [Comamonadaceae bacterium CG_4_9_14_3_um_filter_60_33]|nr:MAG: oxidoreductase [Comamonadaceae bacterium CG_4_10_14_3_um_filter_60_42]PJB45438.1 MAG: oxidoreductase [Comamonadaceae bacterium CG_4_9_14_3_um_filter_60_33]